MAGLKLTRTDRTRSSRITDRHAVFLTMVGLALLCSGCGDDRNIARQIEAKKQARLQSEADQDHLGEAFELLRQISSLDEKQAQRQIAFHLNRWNSTRVAGKNLSAPKLIGTLIELIPPQVVEERIEAETFTGADVNHLRDSFLFRKMVQWIDRAEHEDLLLTEWLDQQEQDLDEISAEQLRTATRLFDWTVRNIAIEPMEINAPTPPPPGLPFGMKLQGAGYRQTDYQTVWRGTGDGLQRAGVFTQLCRQAKIPAAVLATRDTSSGELKPFCVGVLIGAEIYLFETQLGTHIPGPDQVGIATLSQARSDAAVLRRLTIPGMEDQFSYPVGKDDVQQCVALLNLSPETISPRMKHLQDNLTGNKRMVVHVDADARAKALDAVTGVASVRLWNVPILAEIYRATLDKHAERDPEFNLWYTMAWAMLESGVGMSENLASGRWAHLTGQFGDDELESITGARTHYLSQRAPEFDIEDLEIDVDLQKTYGIERDMQMSLEVHQQKVRQIQTFLRMGKRTATYWLSLVQYDDQRFETAENWFKKRVLDEEQVSYWVPPARYNLGRSYEHTGKFEEALEVYKTNGDPQEHGNRIRARLLAKFMASRDEG